MMKKLIPVLGLAVLVIGCTSADKTTKNTINQEEVMTKVSLVTRQ